MPAAGGRNRASMWEAAPRPEPRITMAKFDVYDLEKNKVSEIELADPVFAGDEFRFVFFGDILRCFALLNMTG